MSRLKERYEHLGVISALFACVEAAWLFYLLRFLPCVASVCERVNTRLISSGLIPLRALEAAEVPENQGVEVDVAHSRVIKLLDEATILPEAGEAQHHGHPVITAENHSITGGFDKAITGLLMRHPVTPRFRQIAFPDAFLAAGALPTLHNRYGISCDGMVKQITAWLDA